jgi:hypothetical protein
LIHQVVPEGAPRREVVVHAAQETPVLDRRGSAQGTRLDVIELHA